MTLLGPVLRIGELPAAELHAARLDGDVHSYASGFVCVDEPDTGATRACLAASLAPERSVLELWSAAWVYGALVVPPADTWVAIDVTERVRYAPRAGLHVREVHLPEADVFVTGLVRVTSVLRTAGDLARLCTRDPALPAVLLSFFESGAITPAQLIAALKGAGRLPFRARALDMLAGATFSPR